MMAVHRQAAAKQERKPRRKAAPVTTTRLADSQVWQTAMRLAEGRRSRLVVEGYHRVRVLDARYPLDRQR
jgi:hypothetical protein